MRLGAVADLERGVGGVGRDRGNARREKLPDLLGLVDGPGMHREVRRRGLREERRRDEVLARRDRVDRGKEGRGLARRGQRDAVVEDVARRDLREGLVHALDELGVEGADEAARRQPENRGELRHPAGHGAPGARRHPGRALDLDDVAKRRSVAVKDLLEPRDAVLAELGGDDELLELPGGERPHGQPLGPEEDVLVVENDRLAVAREAHVELDRVGAEALGEVEARDRVLAGPPRRAAVADDPGRVGALPVAHRRRIMSRPRLRRGSRRGRRPGPERRSRAGRSRADPPRPRSPRPASRCASGLPRPPRRAGFREPR